jgi:hypothetical protein
VLAREAAAERRARVRRERRVREEPGEPHQRPVSVDRRVPVEAAEERRRQLARRTQVLVAAEQQREMVRVLPVDRRQRERRHAPGGQPVKSVVLGKLHMA